MPDTTPTPVRLAAELRGRDLYLHCLAKIERHTKPWNQDRWRAFQDLDTRKRYFAFEILALNDIELNRCGTTMCLAGTGCEEAGGIWLLVWDSQKRQLLLNGEPISPHQVTEDDWYFLLAEPSDDDAYVKIRHGIRVIHVRHRARRVFGLPQSLEDPENPFLESHGLPELRELTDFLYPQPPQQ